MNNDGQVDIDEEAIMSNPDIQKWLKFSDTFTYMLGEYRIRIEGGKLKSVTRKLKPRKKSGGKRRRR